MKYFLDTEFIEKPNTIDLISISLVCEDGREYYAISRECNYNNADPWVVENVIMPMYLSTVHGDNRNRISYINFNKEYGKPIQQIKEDLLHFIGTDPEFWAYYAAYDWVVFCWIFGAMVDLPEGYPMYCRDLKHVLDESGLANIPISEGQHNALVDARWNKQLYNHIFKQSK